MSDLRIPELNAVQISGRLTRDPELTYTPGGVAVCKFGIASSRHYKDKQGERQEATTFANVTVWDTQGAYLGDNLQKGDPVLVEGSLESSQWETQAKEKRNKLEIRARRVHQLAWKDGAAPRPKPSDVADNSAAPQDEIPF